MLIDYKIQAGQTIYDLGISTFGTLENLLQLLIQNPSLKNLDYDLNLIATQKIQFSEEYKQKKPAELILSTQINSDIKTLETKKGQSIFDVCLQAYGTLNELSRLLQDNNIYNLNEDDAGRKIINFSKSKVVDNFISDYLIKIT